MIDSNKIFDIRDGGLLIKIKEDDLSAFEEIYIRYWAKIYHYTFNVIHDEDICKDFVQSIFVDLWERRKTVEVINLSAYLYQATRFQIFKHFRYKKYSQYIDAEFDLFLAETDAEKDIEFLELKNKVEEVISNLPEKRRIIFKLSRNEELTHKEISKKLNISLQTVKNQISLAIKTIRDAVKLILILIVVHFIQF